MTYNDAAYTQAMIQLDEAVQTLLDNDIDLADVHTAVDDAASNWMPEHDDPDEE